MKTLKPILAYILLIIAGCWMILFLTPVLFIGGGMHPIQWKVTTFWIFSFIVAIVGIMAIVSGILALVGGKWRFSIVGSVSVILTSLIVTAIDRLVLEVGTGNSMLIATLIPTLLAVPAFILLFLSKNEFQP